MDKRAVELMTRLFAAEVAAINAPMSITRAIDEYKDVFDELIRDSFGPVTQNRFEPCEMETTIPDYYGTMAHELTKAFLNKRHMSLDEAFEATNAAHELIGVKRHHDLTTPFALEDAKAAFMAALNAALAIRRFLPEGEVRTGCTACEFCTEEGVMRVQGNYDLIYGDCLIELKFRKKGNDEPAVYWRQLAAYARLSSAKLGWVPLTLESPTGITQIAWCNPRTGRFERREIL